jgi:putative PEP-CTERM system integral membrane protein
MLVIGRSSFVGIFKGDDLMDTVTLTPGITAATGRGRQVAAYTLFWSWNLIFLAFMFLGFAPTVLPEMIGAVQSGEIPAQFLIYGLLLTAIPLLAVILGLTLLRRDPGRLFALGYGIEGPLMLLLAIRFFVVRQVVPAVALLLIAVGLGIATYLWQLLDKKAAARGVALAHLRLAGLTLLLLTGLYACIWIAFYAVPVGVAGMTNLGNILANFWQSLQWADLWWLLFSLLGFMLLFFSATLFVLMPVAVAILYSKAWWQGWRELAEQTSPWRATALATAVLVLLLLAFIPASRQPQHAAFALLDTAPASLEEARALLDQADLIRDGLLNSYLAPQRYVSSVGEVHHVSQMYEWSVGLSTRQAMWVQGLYESVASPVLYQPINPAVVGEGSRWQNQAMLTEPAQAAELYAQFFDQPLLVAERETVVRAARSTWSIDQAQANWQAVDDREIWLARQEVTISEQGDWAEVELYEAYQNQTPQRQEVVYYFSLPETAVITGVWLGNSDNREARFVYRVAPRGAAQATYQNEFRRNIDPALMEQIGPNQYRLRIFPIEPQRWEWREGRQRSQLQDAPPLHFWLTYRVLARDNSWPMPRLAEKRNVYWDEKTVRQVNSQPMKADDATWLPTAVPLTTPVSRPVPYHRVDFDNGQTVLARQIAPEEMPEPASNLRLALVLDRSRSMTAVAPAVATAVAEMATWDATVDVYLTASPLRGEEPAVITLAELNAAEIFYYGGQNAAELLAQFDALRDGRHYDAVFVLTDTGHYNAGVGELSASLSDAPIWMVHLGGDFPIGYDDATLAAIQASGGGAVTTVNEGLIRQASGAIDTSTIMDGYIWTVLPTGQADTMSAAMIQHELGDGFTAVAARQLILNEMRQQRLHLDQLETLDQLHALAVSQGIVTPYSSMIVLVNVQQHQLLDNLEKQADRFQREFEEVGETTLQPVGITGVPEPEEWLLLALALLLLGWFWQRQQRVMVNSEL